MEAAAEEATREAASWRERLNLAERKAAAEAVAAERGQSV